VIVSVLCIRVSEAPRDWVGERGGAWLTGLNASSEGEGVRGRGERERGMRGRGRGGGGEGRGREGGGGDDWDPEYFWF
jgi:hypothetical protein